MVLHPLAEVGIGMLMAVVIGRGQLVMDILSHGERSQPEDDRDHPQRGHRAKHTQESLRRRHYRHWCKSIRLPILT